MGFLDDRLRRVTVAFKARFVAGRFAAAKGQALK
jgi:hypothetical protein